MAPPRKKPKIKSYLFTWEGTDKKGSRLSGEARATDANMVKADLRRQGVTPIKVRKKPVSIFSKKKKITSADVTVFSRQLATMMSAGVPMVQAFDIVGRGHENPSMQELVLTIKADVEGGTALADALKKHPLHFEDLFVNLVRAGEHAGVLETLLHKIATYKEKTESIKAKIKKALFYPAAIVAAAIIVTAILLIFVIPQFEALFSNFGAELPAFTQMVVSMSHFVRDKWWIILGISFIAVYLFINTWKRSRKLRHTIDRILLKVPVIGMILNKSAIARFSRTLATMSAAGVPLVEALDSVAGATGNVVYSDAVMRMREDVATGQSLQLAMKQRNLFPNMVVQMVSIGEESGSLDDMLNKVADFYEEQVDNAVDAMSSLMEPLIMVVLGTLVGGLVIAMYLPIFKMGTAI
ncbi:MAG: type II secretion system F family protein [Candidatus Thiodiazotropha weberae]|uniref:Type II secretion system protein F n=1 Tax=Candidatus Thiodiazotropha endoloripes TaxID=1818881 RepID=A0A1E2UL83_9GAMM|nr:type II secretion system F family protein [Candidatus Thiodiazotropha endoloripes]MCG7898931.1 type II secretion system F family protein [Candidatus Thiodiazotropha weberae]MCG7916041.1 type II secretion system F family protein [Candidatus Thiodiazotropha weberae]ODB83826.1 type II secretion system protein F [Candidatus Thiodiazotropha endoloripes]ODB90580.1 type II secretion system protein F [Candidatus Thiodiazotropha endoloripes]ODB95510.1 type II secretion system protein F [Candidatus T